MRLDEPTAASTPAIAPHGPTRECKQCGFPRVPQNERICPNCGNRPLVQDVVSRFTNRGALLGMILGPLAGGIWGYFGVGNGVNSMIGCGVLGFMGGMIFGVGGGLVTGLVAKAVGVR